jgi:hypothetical protein
MYDAISNYYSLMMMTWRRQDSPILANIYLQHMKVSSAMNRTAQWTGKASSQESGFHW